MKLQEIFFVAFFVLMMAFLSTLIHSWLGNFKIKYNLETLGAELNSWLHAKKTKNYVENARLIDYVNYHDVPFDADDNPHNASSAMELSIKKIINDYKDHCNTNLEIEQEVECVVYFPKLALHEIFSKLKDEVSRPGIALYGYVNNNKGIANSNNKWYNEVTKDMNKYIKEYNKDINMKILNENINNKMNGKNINIKYIKCN